jgi:mannose-1-phosphate guanylyltransferase
VVEVDDSSRVTRFVEKPQPHETTSRFVNAGTYVLEASALDRIPVGQPLSIERVVFPAMVADGQLAALPTEDYWIDTGRPETYLKANLDLIDGSRSLMLASVAAQAHLDASAVVTHSVIGDACDVGDGAIVIDSVLLPGAHVGPGAKVERSLVMGRVNAGASVVSCVIGKDGIVEAGATLTDVKIP